MAAVGPLIERTVLNSATFSPNRPLEAKLGELEQAAIPLARSHRDAIRCETLRARAQSRRQAVAQRTQVGGAGRETVHSLAANVQPMAFNFQGELLCC